MPDAKPSCGRRARTISKSCGYPLSPVDRSTGSDGPAGPPRVVISESLAERLFASEQPIGRHIWLAATSKMAEIIGVVGEVKHRALDEASLPTVYLSALQAPSHYSIVVVRSTRPDADVIAAVREEVARLDGNLPVYRVRSMAGCGRRLTRRTGTATSDGGIHGIRPACGRAQHNRTLRCRSARCRVPARRACASHRAWGRSDAHPACNARTGRVDGGGRSRHRSRAVDWGRTRTQRRRARNGTV